MDPAPVHFSSRPSSVTLGSVPVADLGPELRGIGTSELLLEDLGEAGAGGPEAKRVAFPAPSAGAVGLQRRGLFWSGLHFPVDTACVRRRPFCVLRRTCPFFPGPRGLGSIRL